jgi:hypothetical protein
MRGLSKRDLCKRSNPSGKPRQAVAAKFTLTCGTIRSEN